MASSVKNTKSRYVWGGTTDVHQTRLGWWERRNIAKSDTDFTMSLAPRYHKRPDLLAYDLYGDAKLQSLILQYNNILDINVEFVTGASITVPTSSRVLFDIINQPTGGNITY